MFCCWVGYLPHLCQTLYPPFILSLCFLVLLKATELLQAAMSAETRSNKEEMLQEAQEVGTRTCLFQPLLFRIRYNLFDF